MGLKVAAWDYLHSQMDFPVSTSIVAMQFFVSQGRMNPEAFLILP
jgi:hypothetical protein